MRILLCTFLFLLCTFLPHLHALPPSSRSTPPPSSLQPPPQPSQPSSSQQHHDASLIEHQQEAQVDMSEDPLQHSPFRVRRVDIDMPVASDAGHTFFEHSQLPHHELQHPKQPVSVVLTLNQAQPDHYDQVLLSVRERQMQSTQGTFLSSPKFTKSDVPLYQEVLREKHLATYYGALKIRNETFRVLFDTGSCELWIPSHDCKTSRCKRHRRLKIRKGTHRMYNAAKMKIEYISGKVAGPMIIETINVGGLAVPNQILGVASTLDIELLDDVVWDGIVGLSYPSPTLVTKGVTPLFDNIIKQKLLSKAQPALANQFAYYIDDTQGVMTFGGVNCDFVVKHSQGVVQSKSVAQCKNSFQFAPVTRKSYWSIKLNDVALTFPSGVQPAPGQQTSGFCGSTGCRAIVDTGTYLIYASNKFHIPSAWSNFKHCGEISKLPNITFHVAGENGRELSLTLEPREYVLKFENAQTECVVGISPDRDHLFTLGQVFLRAYYTLFDRDENRIGFSKIHRHGFQAVNARPSKQPPAGH